MIAVYAFFRSYAVKVQDMENKNTSSDNLIDSLIPLVPTQYIMPPGGDERDFSSHNLKKLLSGEPNSRLKITDRNSSMGYVRISSPLQGGLWVTEVGIWMMSDHKPLVAINHLAQTQNARHTESFFILEEFQGLWIERQNGIMPEMNVNKLFRKKNRVSERLPTPRNLDSVRGNFHGLNLLLEISRNGSGINLGSLEEQIDSMDGFSDQLRWSWSEDAIGPPQEILEIYRAMPADLLMIWDSPSDSIVLLPSVKDNIPNRMRLITKNQALDNQIVIGSHPVVGIFEGRVEIGLFGSLQGGLGWLVGISSHCGMESCSPVCKFYAVSDANWTDVTKQVWDGPDLAFLRKSYDRLPSSTKSEPRLLMENIRIRFNAGSGEFDLIATLLENETGEVVLERLKWNGQKFVRGAN